MKQIITILFLFFSISLQAQAPQWIVYNTGNSGLPGNSITDIAIDTNGIKWIGTGDKGLVRFDGANWTVFDTNNSGIHSNKIFSIAIDSKHNIWAASINSSPGGVSKFDGTSWTNYSPQNSNIPFGGILDMDFDSKGNLWISGLGLGKFDGTNWTYYRDTNSGLPSNSITCVKTQDTIIWIGTQSNGVVKFDGVNWILYNIGNSGLPFNAISWNSISIDSNNVKWIGTFGGGLAKYDDTNWTVYNPNNSGLPYWYVQCVFADENDKVWVGVENYGVSLFENDTNWSTFNTSNSPLPGNFIRDVITDKYKNLWICTSNGLVVYNENGVVSINNGVQIRPIDFNLYQNYPNPFNPSTKIRFSVSKRELINIKVYNIQGKLVSTLVNEQKNPGSYEVEFNGEGSPSGVYFYKLEAGEFVQTRRMVLVK